MQCATYLIMEMRTEPEREHGECEARNNRLHLDAVVQLRQDTKDFKRWAQFTQVHQCSIAALWRKQAVDGTGFEQRPQRGTTFEGLPTSLFAVWLL